ncbi:type VI secretion system baseplate subunit TssF [Pseudoduganella violacea]|uniref:Type VI secretion system protein ImpG n=1 Tax=Pseudoduganella violacea TaxID=1715466 RepID=A0A7W5BC54_9BURK|nr:type VI secretion system baseplate subunit TssF [Pseudoduganella violacea]MBB3120115.1 type VI secretion system protein ImpG [Pseudoduganella violacea]
MEQLLPYLERELLALRHASPLFGARYPGLAGALAHDGAAVDPHADRLAQAVAMLNARIAKRLDDDYPRFISALFQMLYPQHWRPFPACAIVCLDGQGAALPRGATLQSAPVDSVACCFRTVYDVCVSPARIASAAYVARPDKPDLPVFSSLISITIEELPGSGQECLRIYLDGEASFCAALRDAFFLKARLAYVETRDGLWHPLPSIPLRSVGFAEDEALLPRCPGEDEGERLLKEYFSFPQKFNFIDLDIAALRHYPGRRLILHLLLPDAQRQASPAQVLGTLSADNLRIGATPVVNLFPRAANPISVTHMRSEYELEPSGLPPSAGEIFAIDSVRMATACGKVDIYRPFFRQSHGEEEAKGRYWIAHRCAGRSGMRIALSDGSIDLDGEGCAAASIDLLCCNADLPRRLVGDLRDDTGQRLQLLGQPSPLRPAPLEAQNEWRLLALLSRSGRGLQRMDAQQFAAILSLFDPVQSPSTRRLVEGIVSIEWQPAQASLSDCHGAWPVQGFAIRMTLDQSSYAGSGLHLFAQVIEHFLATQVHLNSFTQLTVVSAATGEELLRCPPRNGNLSLR